MNTTKALYRDTEHARIAGVCAGVANYFGIERWLVRILFVTGFFLLAGPFMLVAYIACWFILDKQPLNQPRAASGFVFQQSGKGWRNRSGEQSSQKVEVKTKVWQAGEPPRQAFHDISKRFSDAEHRLRKMEKYVTSKEYQLNREISRL
ncbi:envelope stress response membrane protein PspC [Alteromonas aestuariivivens]|uniref:Envelope stress response membrane protein PspC n=1 Tax=Alteromonas aestuariivivens TaxID=1938339 RepID=A0A3D8M6B8_9ALTE|nr:envelope stress response membrane protein PspC [Alteromonas aestuariivivens]RDV25120.1 envelope stress response membrane protein PspC [Alteromonas aestuariivivens]